MRWSRVRRVLLALILLGALIVVTLAATLLAYGSQDRARPVDVIVVLGAGEIGTERRTAHAIDLYHQEIAPWLLCSGGYRGPNGMREAEVCAAQAQEAGVPESAIVLEPESRSTEQNAQNAAAIMRDQGWQSAVIVSDNYHLLRARWLFSREDVTVWTSPAPDISGDGNAFDSVYYVVREVGAVVYQAGKIALGL